MTTERPDEEAMSVVDEIATERKRQVEVACRLRIWSKAMTHDKTAPEPVATLIAPRDAELIQQWKHMEASEAIADDEHAPRRDAAAAKGSQCSRDGVAPIPSTRIEHPWYEATANERSDVSDPVVPPAGIWPDEQPGGPPAGDIRAYRFLDEPDDGRPLHPHCQPSPSPAIGDVEKLIERLEHWAHNYSINNPMQSVGTLNEAAAMLRALAAEVERLKPYSHPRFLYNVIKADEEYQTLAAEKAKVDHFLALATEELKREMAKVDALRAEKAKVEEDNQKKNDALRLGASTISKQRAEIASLRAKLVRAREGLGKIAIQQITDEWDGEGDLEFAYDEIITVARATLEEIKE